MGIQFHVHSLWWFYRFSCISDNFRNVALWSVRLSFCHFPIAAASALIQGPASFQESGKHCARNERNFVLFSVSSLSSRRFRSSARPGPLSFSFCFFERWPTITTSHKQWSWLSWWRWGDEVFLHLAAAALAGSLLGVCNVLFVVAKRYYVSSWICSRSHGTEDSASSSKPPCAFSFSPHSHLF